MRSLSREWSLAIALALVLSACTTTPDESAMIRPTKRPSTLDVYVHAPDSSFEYKLVNTLTEDDVTLYVLDMTSQTWRDPSEVNRTRWRHWVSIYVPEQVSYDSAMLYIGGGNNGHAPPDQMSPEFSKIASVSESIVVYLGMVPNQPLVFADDGSERSEDEMIAYTWNKYLHTGDENWPARMPMTKSAVRAMDAVQAFCATEEGGAHGINSFVVVGGSKRGWTTWTTAAVDGRVKALVPIVIDMLNVKASFKHHWEAYGFWAPAVGDYEAMGLMEWIGTEEYDALLALIEPYNYISRITMPKLIMNSCGDQFFLPDSSQFYWDDLVGDKYLRYVPNTGHGLEGSDAFYTLLAFYHSIISDTPLPQYAWEFKGNNTLTVTTTGQPLEVKYWTATNPHARDFRVDEIGKIWKSTPLVPMGDGVYQVQLQTPENGWTAQMVELTFAGPKGTPLKYTTPVKVLPERLPYRYTAPTNPPKGYLAHPIYQVAR